MHELGLCHIVDERHRDMRTRTEAGGAIGAVASRIFADQIDQIFKRRSGHICVHHDTFRVLHHTRNRRKIACNVERGFIVQETLNQNARNDHAEGVAIGRRLGDYVRADEPPSADSVFSNDRLIPRDTHRCTDFPAQHIRLPAGRERRDHAHPPAGITRNALSPRQINASRAQDAACIQSSAQK